MKSSISVRILFFDYKAKCRLKKTYISKMSDSHARKMIFKTFDNHDSGSDEDLQVSDPDESESSEDDGCKA